MPIEQDDLPPGAPKYAAGPLANQPPPNAGAVLASGQSPDSYFAPKGVPILQAANAEVSGLGQVARGLMNRAASGMANLFGTTEAAPEATGITSIANRTKTLEGGLNDLEMRSTGFRKSPDIKVAANSAADEANLAFASRQGPTPAEYNALPPAQRKALDNFNNLPSAQRDKTPNFYQQMIANQEQAAPTDETAARAERLRRVSFNPNK